MPAYMSHQNLKSSLAAHLNTTKWGQSDSRGSVSSPLFSVNYFCRRIASPKSLLYESGCLN